MAAPTSTSSSACFSASEEFRKRVIVRNTFIDLADECTEARRPRSSSAPALTRPRSPCSGGDWCGGLEEDASTDGGETGSFADSSSAADRGETESFADSSLAAEADAMSPAESEQAARRRAHEPLPAEPPRVPLRSSAKAFTPSAPTPATPMGTRKFKRDLQALANAVKGVIESRCDFVIGAEAGYSSRGWFVSASISAQSLRAKEWLLAQAQEAICGAQLRHSRVMGRGAQPFKTTPLGFAVMLGHVPDEGKVCWNMLTHGFCRHGEFCHWQHPPAQTILSVEVNVVAE